MSILIGERFGRLIVLSIEAKAPKENDGHTYYLCRCMCGRTTIVRDTHLTTGHTKSCGCLILKPKKKGVSYVRVKI